MAALGERQHAHELLERVHADQIVAAVRFLEFLLLDPVSRTLASAPLEDEEISEEEEQAVARSNCRPDEEQKDPAA
jgi:hypothetical protein